MDDKSRESEQQQADAQGAEPLASLALGGTGGAYLGGVMGLAVGGPIGLLAGATLGTVAGAYVAHGVASGWREAAFRDHHHAFRPQGGGHTWEQASPAYRHGWEGHDRPEIRGRSWTEAGPHLEKSWPGPGPYHEYEPYVRHAWERRASDPSKSEPGANP